jgi:hypothetical protein
VFHICTHQSTERDSAGQSSEEDEDGGSQTHGVEGVGDVALQMRNSLLELADDSAKGYVRPHERIEPVLLSLLCGQCCKIFMAVIYNFCLIIHSVCPWQAFPVWSNIYSQGQSLPK